MDARHLPTAADRPAAQCQCLPTEEVEAAEEHHRIAEEALVEVEPHLMEGVAADSVAEVTRQLRAMAPAVEGAAEVARTAAPADIAKVQLLLRA
jgi:hypothetical protein